LKGSLPALVAQISEPSSVNTSSNGCSVQFHTAVGTLTEPAVRQCKSHPQLNSTRPNKDIKVYVWAKQATESVTQAPSTRKV